MLAPPIISAATKTQTATMGFSARGADSPSLTPQTSVVSGAALVLATFVGQDPAACCLARLVFVAGVVNLVEASVDALGVLGSLIRGFGLFCPIQLICKLPRMREAFSAQSLRLACFAVFYVFLESPMRFVDATALGQILVSLLFMATVFLELN